jgi:hypothetical protein
LISYWITYIEKKYIPNIRKWLNDDYCKI